VTSYIASWYADAAEDEVISVEEQAELGAGICRILGVKADINLSEEE
jgi:hypothetical protein